MADPAPSTTGKWLWPLLIALLAILLLVWLFSPSGERDGEVEDPIATPELSDPAAEQGAGLTGDGLPAGDEAAPVGPDAPMADTTVEREPTDEPVAVPDPAVPLPNAAGQGQ